MVKESHLIQLTNFKEFTDGILRIVRIIESYFSEDWSCHIFNNYKKHLRQ